MSETRIPKNNLQGRVFDRLTVLGLSHINGKRVFWKCLCQCGNESVVRADSITSGKTRSCGCLLSESARRLGKLSAKHGKCQTRAYNIWNKMILRCSDPSVRAFKWYGLRGISVCERWQKFENFYADMGEKPEGMSIERIDNNGNYEPSNCRWATQKEQMNNTRNNRWIELDGKRLTLTQWAEQTGIGISTIHHRIKHGWPISKALTERP